MKAPQCRVSVQLQLIKFNYPLIDYAFINHQFVHLFIHYSSAIRLSSIYPFIHHLFNNLSIIQLAIYLAVHPFFIHQSAVPTHLLNKHPFPNLSIHQL